MIVFFACMFACKTFGVTLENRRHFQNDFVFRRLVCKSKQLFKFIPFTVHWGIWLCHASLSTRRISKIRFALVWSIRRNPPPPPHNCYSMYKFQTGQTNHLLLYTYKYANMRKQCEVLKRHAKSLFVAFHFVYGMFYGKSTTRIVRHRMRQATKPLKFDEDIGCSKHWFTHPVSKDRVLHWCVLDV